MTPIGDTPPGRDDALVLDGLELTGDDLGGHSIDELADYFDAGETPADPSIDDSAGCQIALAAIARLRALTAQLAVDDETSESQVDEGWVSGILNQIGLQARAGRDIPLGFETGPASLLDDLVITEGALRAIVRAAGDRVPGLLIGRCRFEGDVTAPGEPVVIDVDASVIVELGALDDPGALGDPGGVDRSGGGRGLVGTDALAEGGVMPGQSIQQAAEDARQAILADVTRHTRLTVVAVNVTVHDVHLSDPNGPPADGMNNG